MVLAAGGEWWEAGLLTAMLAFYLLAVRLTRCRVETIKHRPCRWRVRGLLGSCDYHVGYKKSLPTLVRGNNFMGLPTFMWPRDDFAGKLARQEDQPAQGARGIAAAANRARRPGYDWVMLGFSAAGVLITLATFVRSFFPR